MTDLTGKICLITGATNGIGEVTARELARLGMTVVIVARNADKARRVTAEIKAVTGNQNVEYITADLSIMDEIRRAAETFRERYDQLHVLVNNVGAIFTEYHKTADGYERTFALNHLSYFLLTDLLLDMLKATGTPDEKARIINVSSDAHQIGEMQWENLQGEKSYNGLRAYGQSKLENILFTYELARRLEAENADVTANALHPGGVATGFGHNNGGFTKIIMTLVRPFLIGAEKGAATSIYLASSPEVEGVTGQYFENCQPKKSSAASYKQASWSRLWEISEELTGLKTPTVEG